MAPAPLDPSPDRPRFDPNAAAAADSGIFGLASSEAESAVVLVPVPFAATVSYGGGAERGPEAILAASRQVDLYDLQYGRAYERGINLCAADPSLLPSHTAARTLAEDVIAHGGATAGDTKAIAAIDAAGAALNRIVHAATRRILA